MRVVVIDPRAKKIIHVPRVIDPGPYCAIRLGLSFSLCHVQSPTIDDDKTTNGIVVAQEGEDDLTRPGQSYFRLPGCPITFPGKCIFIGINPEGKLTDLPELMWKQVSSKVIWCCKTTRVFGYVMSVKEMITPTDGTIVQNIYHPIYVQGENRDGEGQTTMA